MVNAGVGDNDSGGGSGLSDSQDEDKLAPTRRRAHFSSDTLDYYKSRNSANSRRGSGVSVMTDDAWNFPVYNPAPAVEAAAAEAAEAEAAAAVEAAEAAKAAFAAQSHIQQLAEEAAFARQAYFLAKEAWVKMSRAVASCDDTMPARARNALLVARHAAKRAAMDAESAAKQTAEVHEQYAARFRQLGRTMSC
eukprot:TRINITY_DN29228_c0_g2_i1.p1 TRINITY_DN29228_c0_g2~~TRINITY_DN29228_c0_g2_i1.p1  ORF type:complete len:193 (-),score=51.06 TRINITY_DN29228_c0_g2_i1:78-656(-)